MVRVLVLLPILACAIRPISANAEHMSEEEEEEEESQALNLRRSSEQRKKVNCSVGTEGADTGIDVFEYCPNRIHPVETQTPFVERNQNISNRLIKVNKTTSSPLR